MSVKFKKAVQIANEYHKGQMRRDGTPFIDHPLRVAKLLEEHGFPEEALIAAVLHDICEDTDISNLRINELFGTRVGFIVNALTKNKKPKNNKKLKEDYIEKQNKKKITNLEKYTNYNEYINYRFHLYINRFYMGIIAEPWIFYIKISDQIHNLSTMGPFNKDKQERKIEEIEKFFMPIYIKSEEIFSIDSKTLREYDIFINLLNKELLKAKLNIPI